MEKIFKHLRRRISATANIAGRKPAPAPAQLPTLWLLGKTGAGKSTLIQAITGRSDVEIGNGFSPCTRSSRNYDFPPEKPLLRFLDTRGLAEADYNAAEDIAACTQATSALIVVMKAEEPEQSTVIKALAGIRKSGAINHLLLVHTGILLLDDELQRRQAIVHNQHQVEAVWKESVKSVAVDFGAAGDRSVGVEELRAALADFLPIVALLDTRKEHATVEESRFAPLRNDILWYAAASGGTDAFPVVGLGTVPMIQAKMLHHLAGQYGISWNKKALADFVAALGAGFSVQYLSKLGVRQLTKLIPVYGQTVGSTAAVVVSFCSTYAIGRAACKYLYHQSKGEAVSEQELKRLYRQAFNEVRKVKSRETAIDRH
ncbi:MAG: GTPase [Pelovirga sp.]